jgi:hypothetical protein
MKELEHAAGWYYRKDGETYGPFVAGLISRYILLGRIAFTDEVSRDGEHWMLAQDFDEIIPEVMKADQHDPEVQQRLMAAMRWADERQVDRRLHESSTAEQRERRRVGDRRALEDEAVVGYREKKLSRSMGSGSRVNTLLGWLVIVVAICSLSALGWYIYTSKPKEVFIDCNSAPGPNVNFNNCVMEGVDFSSVDMTGASFNNSHLSASLLRFAQLSNSDLRYADFSLVDMTSANLQNARVVGANFRNAILITVNFSDADLSYADFSGAKIDGALFNNARLDHAYWVDGRECAPGSTGTCR